MAETKSAEKELKEVKSEPKPEKVEAIARTVQQMELPELMGNVTRRILQTPMGPAKGAVVNDCLRDLRIWYDAQPVDGRRQMALDMRAALEEFRRIADAFFHETITVTARDL